jgi:pimeloyl-ACP methyl ester carboxylesterase
MIEALRASLPARRRELFDYFARSTRAGRQEGPGGAALASGLALACQRVEPLLEPMSALAHVSLPTRLIHGRGDRLIPFTEGLRLGGGLPKDMLQDLTVTGLIDHSADCVPSTWAGRVREGAAFFGAMRGLINMV